jgi:hypothetical protein
LKQNLVSKRLAEECDGTSLQCPQTGCIIVVSGDKNDWDLAAQGSEMALKL